MKNETCGAGKTGGGVKGPTERTWGGIVDGALAGIRKRLEAGPGAFTGLATGFLDLDSVLHGLRAGELILVAGRPGMGKTTFAMNLAECVALGQSITGEPNKMGDGKRHPVLFVSLDMSADSFAARMLYSRAGVSGWRVWHGLMAKAERAEAARRLDAAKNDLKAAPLDIEDIGIDSIEVLCHRAKALKKDHGIELVVVDNLQLCPCADDKGYRQGLAVARQLKNLALGLQVPVIGTLPIRGEGAGRPALVDLRETGVTQAADVILLLHRPCLMAADPEHDRENLAIIDVAKCHDAVSGQVRLDFARECLRFGNRDRREDTEG